MANSRLVLLLFLLFSASSIQSFQPSQYGEAVGKAILFYEGMRSGKLPPNQRLRWRGDSGLSDGRAQNVDLTGGYHDSGDNVKFHFPMAFTITLLAWSTREYASQLHNVGELGHARDAVRWGSDYLLKTWDSRTQTLWVQVGNGYADHACWERPEDMDTPRTAFSINPSKPGSDVAAETAAALAAGSNVFRKSDPAYSAKLLLTAKQIFDFADRYRGSYSNVLGSVVGTFYPSFSGFRDELLWGATWLLRASGDRRYLDYIIQHGPELGGPSTSYTALSWDNKYAGVDVLLAREYMINGMEQLRPYKDRADDFVCSAMPGKAHITPGGLFFQQSSSNMQYVTNNAFLLVTYAKYLTSHKQIVSCQGLKPEQLVAFAKRQVDYILGDNPMKMSYMVGFGAKFPGKIHHRGASLPSIHVQKTPIGCNAGFNYLHASSPDPNVLVGAVVGGPDSSDHFSNNRDDYSQAEVSTYTNAGLVGALAYFAA